MFSTDSPGPEWALAAVVAQCVLLGMRAVVQHRFERSPAVPTHEKPPLVSLSVDRDGDVHLTTGATLADETVSLLCDHRDTSVGGDELQSGGDSVPVVPLHPPVRQPIV